MKKNIDIKQGDVFGKLVVIKQIESYKDKHKRFICKCSCGREQIARATDLRNKKKTCCLKCSRKNTNKTHGLTKTKAYKAWLCIKQRCYYKSNISYKYYGARGIKMCDEWKNNPVAFCDWYNKNKIEGCTIDRINVNEDYSPKNCKFSTIKQQGRNKRNNVLVEYEGKVINASECAENVGIKTSAMIQRINRHKNDKRIFQKTMEG